MMFRWCRRSLPALAAALVGCWSAPAVVSLAPPRREHRAADYEATRERWTRAARIIKNLDTPLRVHATLFAPDFVSAYVAKRDEIFRLPSASGDDTDRREREAADRAWVFLVSATTTDLTWNDLERRDSIWRVAFRNDRGEEATPIEVKVEKTSATVVELFPFVGPFSRVYRIRFPKTLANGRPLIREETTKLVLLFSGAMGQTELVWQLR